VRTGLADRSGWRRRWLGALFVATLPILTLTLAGCQPSVPSATGPRSTSVADDATATCAPSALGATTAKPVKPGPTALGVPTLPEGDLPMGRYTFDLFITIDAPCWQRLRSPVDGTLAFARSDVPDDRLTIARARRSMVDPCDPAKLVDLKVAAVATWFRALPGVTAEDRPSMRIDGRDATMLRLTATAAGACSDQVPGFDAGDAALFGLPFVQTRDAGQAADVAILDHPTTKIVTVIVATAADATALDSFGPLVRRVLRSLEFDFPAP
jgi:hypothetical protein